LTFSASHWDFLSKFLSLHYYTTLEGVLGVQRSGQAQGTMICSMEKLLFFGIFSKFVQFWLENSNPNQLDELKWIILLLLTPKPSIEAE
jgi:hypothetical protein